MNFGMQDIQHIIYNQLVQGSANVSGGRGKFAKDLAKRIYEFIESKTEIDMNQDMKTIARARGISEDVINFSDRACRAFGFSIMPMDDISVDAYKWVMQQPQTIEQFADWARTDEQGRYIGKYRKNAGNIKNDWARAFAAGKVEFQVEDVRI